MATTPASPSRPTADQPSPRTADVGGVRIGLPDAVPGRPGEETWDDRLGAVLCAHLLGELVPPPEQETLLLTTGSALSAAPAAPTAPAAGRRIVWGAGLDDLRTLPSAAVTAQESALDVRSVRGPWTRRLLHARGIAVPAVYGDPLLLLPFVMPEPARRPATAGDLLLAPDPEDLLDEDGARIPLPEGAVPADAVLLDPWEDRDLALRRILTARCVVGSSVAAIAVAEAFGVPSRLIRSGRRGTFAARDYLAGSGRALDPIARDLYEALALGPHAGPRVDEQALLESFPRDAWTGEVRAPVAPRPGSEEREAAVCWIGDLAAPPDALPDRSDAYGRLLEELLRGTDAVDDADADADAAELIAQRRWIFSEVRPGDLPEAVRGIDAAVRRGDPEGLRGALVGARLGPQAVLRDCVVRGRRTILGLDLRLPDHERALDGVELRCGQDVEEVPGLALPRRHRGEVDLEVIVPRAWEAHLPGGARAADPVQVRIAFADGGRTDLPLRGLGERADPRHGTDRPDGRGSAHA